MNAALQSVNQSISMWDDISKIEEIRKLFAPTLTDMEFQFFVGLGKASNLNPFTREIWSIKYDKNQPAQVFIGRDGYRKAAQGHSEYDYHQSDAVYENDEFAVVNGEIHHKYTMANRGKLIGAYCVAKRHKSSRPIYVFAELGEYSTGRSVWKDKPATMIKKVAESQCLRACFQDLLGGTYGEEEMGERSEQYAEPKPTKSQALMDKIKAAKGTTIEAEAIDVSIESNVSQEKIQNKTNVVHNTGSDELPVNQDQINEIEGLMFDKNFDNARRQKALDYFKVKTIDELTDAQARVFLLQLGKA